MRSMRSSLAPGGRPMVPGNSRRMEESCTANRQGCRCRAVFVREPEIRRGIGDIRQLHSTVPLTTLVLPYSRSRHGHGCNAAGLPVTDVWDMAPRRKR
jgi:hypothetical protein